jgi:hypothetical protein
VSFGVARDGLHEFQRPLGAFAHLVKLLKVMEQTKPSCEANLAEAIKTVSRLVPRRGVLIVFSDLLEELEPIFEALSIWAHRGSDVIVFHTLHADELKLPPLHEATFIDSETGGRVKLHVEDVRETYDRKMREFLDTCATWCRARRIDYNLVSTATPYQKSLEQYLFTRAAMA